MLCRCACVCAYDYYDDQHYAPLFIAQSHIEFTPCVCVYVFIYNACINLKCTYIDILCMYACCAGVHVCVHIEIMMISTTPHYLLRIPT